jgi:hypothetical protein
MQEEENLKNKQQILPLAPYRKINLTLGCHWGVRLLVFISLGPLNPSPLEPFPYLDILSPAPLICASTSSSVDQLKSPGIVCFSAARAFPYLTAFSTFPVR